MRITDTHTDAMNAFIDRFSGSGKASGPV